MKSQSVRKQREAIRIVERRGGSLLYDYQYRDDQFGNSPPKPSGLAILRKLIGDDYFADLVKVEIPNVSDQELHRLAEQATIRHLVVSGTLTDESLESISHLRNLAVLEIRGGTFTQVGLAKLSNLPKLRALTLGDSEVSDEAAASIGLLATLEELALPNTRLASKQLRHFKALQRLSVLDLSDTSVGDKGLIELKDLRQLTTVRLDRTMVTAKGIRKLQEASPQLQITPTIMDRKLF